MLNGGESLVRKKYASIPKSQFPAAEEDRLALHLVYPYTVQVCDVTLTGRRYGKLHASTAAVHQKTPVSFTLVSDLTKTLACLRSLHENGILKVYTYSYVVNGFCYDRK